MLFIVFTYRNQIFVQHTKYCGNFKNVCKYKKCFLCKVSCLSFVLGFSQGGLVARALIESSNKHNVHTFISLSSPQGGQYGGMLCKQIFYSSTPVSRKSISNINRMPTMCACCVHADDFLRIYFPGYVKETAWRFLYSRPGQLTSVGNYWRDPHHLDSFLNYSTFLPEVNNEIVTPDTMKFKRNFLKLQRLVLIGGPDDGVISPWQSRYASFLFF